MDAPVACFGSGHRKICKQVLRKLDIKFGKPAGAIEGFPGGVDWFALWHDIFHEWNARVLECAEQAGVKWWSRRCLEQQWNLANYIANLPHNNWVKRALAWTAGRRTKMGTPADTRDTQINMYCRWQIYENGGQPECRHTFSWHMWTLRKNFRRRTSECWHSIARRAAGSTSIVIVSLRHVNENVLEHDQSVSQSGLYASRRRLIFILSTRCMLLAGTW